jgi:RES domain-containing protein
MIFTTLEKTPAFRMHAPHSAVEPTRGAETAENGGRVNRPGVEALYLALDIDTAVKEYQQNFELPPPGTLVSYWVTAAPIADFRLGYQPGRWSPLWERFFCDWRELWFKQKVEPPTWVLADEVLAAGAKGLLFPSQLSPGGINLVLYPERLTAADTIEVHNPGDSLPKNQHSWS